MGKIIVLASGKGGTGKSTVAVGLAISFVRKSKKVLLIDCDCGMRGLDIMLDVDKEIVFDTADIVSGGCSYDKAIYKSGHIENLYLMPAPFSSDDELSPEVFDLIVQKIKNDYDYVIIDSPAGVGTGFITAATPAEMALIVVNAEPTSMRGCLKIREKLLELGIHNIRLVINRFNKEAFYQMGIYRDLDEVIDIGQTQLIALVPEDYRIVGSVQTGSTEPIWSMSGLVFDCLSKRIEGEDVPLAYS